MSILVMGVAGTGKSTVAAALAARIGWAWIDADDLHPSSSIAKMSAGTPLDDVDRAPWLEAVGVALARQDVVVACSALKRRYRDRLRAADPDMVLIHLHGDALTLTRRMSGRHHFMAPSMLASQLAALERPTPDERALELDIAPPVDEIVAAAVARIRTRAGTGPSRDHPSPTPSRTL